MKRKTLVPILAVVAIATPTYWLIGAELRASKFRVNLSKSVPIGMYVKTSAVAPYAAICLSREILAPAIAAGMEIRAGECRKTGMEPILKPLYEASEQRPILFTKEGFYVGAKLLVKTAPKAVSMTGMPLSHYRFGLYASGLWAISDFNSSSYDSRYFGPVDSSEVIYYARPLLTANF